VSENDKRLPRPVRLSDVAVVTAGFVMNLTKSVSTFCEDLYELSIYHANRKTKENEVWQEMTTDLETLWEETDGK
jgi:hypothetical protein